MLTVNGTLTLDAGSTFVQRSESQLYVSDNFTNNGATLTLDPTSEVGLSATPSRSTLTHAVSGTGTTGLTV